MRGSLLYLFYGATPRYEGPPFPWRRCSRLPLSPRSSHSPPPPSPTPSDFTIHKARWRMLNRLLRIRNRLFWGEVESFSPWSRSYSRHFSVERHLDFLYDSSMENQTEERAGGEASGGGGGGGGDQDGLVHTPTTVLVDAELSVDEIGATISFKGLPTDVPQAKLCTFERHSDVSETVHEGAFSTTSYLSFLRTERLGRALLYSECTRSTQDMLGEANGDETFRSRLELLKWKRGSEVDIAPLLCLADRQTKGRGRGGNTWSSPLGCLLFSYSSRFRGLAEERLPFFQVCVCVCACACVRVCACVFDARVCICLFCSSK